jgi:hypothetical protein
VLVAHIYNPSYSGGRDQEVHVLKPAGANSSLRPYLEKPFIKIGLMEWLKMKAMSSSPSTAKKKKRRVRQEDHEFKDSLDYIVRPYHKF